MPHLSWAVDMVVVNAAAACLRGCGVVVAVVVVRKVRALPRWRLFTACCRLAVLLWVAVGVNVAACLLMVVVALRWLADGLVVAALGTAFAACFLARSVVAVEVASQHFLESVAE